MEPSSNTPKISVLMPAYNAEQYIGAAIESILAQTFTDFEFIIIDDCSSDATWDLIQDFARQDSRIVNVRNNVNSKICKTLNRGIEIAKGKYIARMDADDWSYPDRLEKQFAFMEANPDVVISGGTMEVCDENLKVLNERHYNLTDVAIRKKIFRYSPFCHPLVMYRTQTAQKVSGYDALLHDAEDYDFYFRLGMFGKFSNTKDRLLKLRTNPNSVSQKNVVRQEKLTLQIRLKAVREYGYKMSLADRLYWITQYASMYIIPAKFKFWLFNLIR